MKISWIRIIYLIKAVIKAIIKAIIKLETGREETKKYGSVYLILN